MRKKIKWSQCTGVPIQNAGEQLIALPLAISDHDGNPHKGQKSYMTKALANRYKNVPNQSSLMPTHNNGNQSAA